MSKQKQEKQSKKLSQKEIIDWWLTKYHNTTLDKVQEEFPELKDSREFYNKYRVTQEQHDEWYEWVIGEVMRTFKLSKTKATRAFIWDYLNTSPLVIKEVK